MVKYIHSIEDCLSYLEANEQPIDIIKNIGIKLESVLKYINKEEKIDGFNVWLYEREAKDSGFGFCLLKDDEELKERVRAKQNFIAIKPKSINTSNYFNGKKFEQINKDFLNLSPKEFADKFLKAAKDRAADKKPA